MNSVITSSNIQNMMATEKLMLTKTQLFWHYSILLLLLVSPLYTTILVVKHYVLHNYHGVRPIQEMMIGYYFLAPFILVFFIQKNRLRFRKIYVTCSSNEFEDVVKKTASDLEWKIEQFSKTIAVATSGVSFGSWGERITILRTKDYILFNSICDPDNRPSIASWSMNKINRKTFEKRLMDLIEQRKAQ